MGYLNNYSGNHVDVCKMTTEEKKAYYEEQRKRQEELVYHSYCYSFFIDLCCLKFIEAIIKINSL